MELKMGEAVGRHIARMSAEGKVSSVTVHPTTRLADGWLEWIIQYQWVDGGGITVGAIQRKTPDDLVEFHS